MWPYSSNPIRDTFGRVRNWNDGLNIFNDSHGPEGDYDPVFKAEKLGAIIDQGLLAFITMVRLYFSGLWDVRLMLVFRSLRSRASMQALHTRDFEGVVLVSRGARSSMCFCIT